MPYQNFGREPGNHESYSTDPSAVHIHLKLVENQSDEVSVKKLYTSFHDHWQRPKETSSSTDTLVHKKTCRFYSVLTCCSNRGEHRPRTIFGLIVLAMFSTALLVLGIVIGIRDLRGSTQPITRTVDLGYSRYTGVEDKNLGVVKWLGIRYAAPPVGDLRFRAPSDPEVEDTTYLANKLASPCHSTPSGQRDPHSSEDCLFLNVYAPSKGKLHPVYVFIQGGGLNELANTNLDGTNLVVAGDNNIVVVTFNYRVGPFGFLASKEVQQNGDLNSGLLDQRKVLEWIQKNIEWFGGDPNHVTLGGSSAGAGSVALHLTAYDGRDDGLFHAAVAGSPSFGGKNTVEGSQYQYDTLVRRVNCSTVDDTLLCLRNLDINILTKHNQNIRTHDGGGGYPVFPYTNVIDGNFITNNTYSLFMEGKFVKVPVIFGGVTNEGTIFTPTSIGNVTEMNNFLKDNFPRLDDTQLGQLDSYFPIGDQFPGKGKLWSAAAKAYGEMRYTCPGIYLSSQFFKYGIQESWNYRWDVLKHQNAVSGLGVTHTADLNSVWGISQPPEKALIPTMQGYWTSFIRTYNPNTFKLETDPPWETYDLVSSQRIHFASVEDVSMESIDDNQLERCAWVETQSRAIQM